MRWERENGLRVEQSYGRDSIGERIWGLKNRRNGMEEGKVIRPSNLIIFPNICGPLRTRASTDSRLHFQLSEDKTEKSSGQFRGNRWSALRDPSRC